METRFNEGARLTSRADIRRKPLDRVRHVSEQTCRKQSRRYRVNRAAQDHAVRKAFRDKTASTAGPSGCSGVVRNRNKNLIT